MKFIIKPQIFIIGFRLIFLTSCSQQIVYKSVWQANDFSSATNAELQAPLRFCDAKSKLQYNITNDDKNIYICIKVTDEQYQMKIIHAGMQISIDTTGKEEQQMSILYPLAGQGKPKMPTDLKTGQQNDKKANPMKTQFLLEQNKMQLSGFKSPINGLVPLQNDSGISVNIAWDSLNIMYYKAIIPFNTFYKKTLNLSDSTKIFDFSFTVNAMDIPADKMRGTQGGGEIPEGGNMSGSENIPSGSGVGGSGGLHPNGRGSEIPIDNSFSEKNIIEVKIKMDLK